MACMQQLDSLRRRYPNALLLIRAGDEFVAYGADAYKLSERKGIPVSVRDPSMPMAGFPRHHLEQYLGVLGDITVAVIDELDAPAEIVGGPVETLAQVAVVASRDLHQRVTVDAGTLANAMLVQRQIRKYTPTNYAVDIDCKGAAGLPFTLKAGRVRP